MHFSLQRFKFTSLLFLLFMVCWGSAVVAKTTVDASIPNVIRSGDSPELGASPVTPTSLTGTDCANVASGYYPSSIDVTLNSAKLSWTGPSSGTYTLQWRPINGNWTTVPIVNANNYSLTGLTTGASYQFQVSTVCSVTSASDYSAPVSFSVTCPRPYYLNTFSLAPTSASLNWISSIGNYNVQWRQQGAGSWNGPFTGLTSNTYSLTGLSSSTQYEFQVEAACAGGTSGYVGPQSFSTTACLNTATNLNSTNLNNNAASLSWTAPGGGNLFSVRWRPINSQTWSTTQVSGFNYTVPQLASGQYEWQIARACSTTDLSGYSGSKFFTTTSLSCSNVATNLFSSTNNTVVDLSWNSSPPGSYTFAVQYRLSSSSSWNELTTVSSSSLSTAVSVSGLTVASVYDWRVAQVCSSTTTSNYTNTASFTTTSCANVASGYYPTQVTLNSAFLSWTGPSSGTYTVQWRPIDGNWTTVPIVNANGYSLTGLSTGTVYQFKVSTVCAGGGVSDYGTPVSFTVTCPKPTQLNIFSSNASSVGLSWSSSIGNYNLQWRQQGAPNWNGPITGLTSTFYSLTSLTSSTQYEFQVEAVCSATSTSGYSVPRSFSTTSCVNTATSLGSFGLTTNAASLSWTAPGGGNLFSVRWKPVSSQTWAATLVSGFVYSLTGLTPNTPYEWQIARACSSTDLSAYSGSKLFSTLASSVTVQTSTNRQGCNETTTVTAMGGFTPYTYLVVANGQSFSNTTGQFVGLPSGAYSVSAIDVNGSTGVSSFSATLLVAAVSILPLNATVCSGLPTSLTASGCSSGTLVWSTGQSTSVISVSTTAVGTTVYSATCLASGDCIAIGSTAITVQPVLTLSPITVSGLLGSSGTSVTINAQTSGGTAYTLTNVNGFVAANATGLFSVSQVGLYTVSAINSGGCKLVGSTSVLPASSPIVSNTFVVNNMLTCPENGQPAPTSTANLAAVATGNVFIFTGPNGYVFSNVYRTSNTYNIFASGITQAGSYTLTVYNQGALTGTYSQAISSTCTSTSAGGRSINKSQAAVNTLHVMLGKLSIASEYVSITVEGAEGQPLTLGAYDEANHLLDQVIVDQAKPVENQQLRLGTQRGSFYLKVSTPGAEKTIWLAR